MYVKIYKHDFTNQLFNNNILGTIYVQIFAKQHRRYEMNQNEIFLKALVLQKWIIV